MFTERSIVCHDTAGKPCGRLTEHECNVLESAGSGRAVRSRKGALVRFMLDAMPESRESFARDSVMRIEWAREKFGDAAVRCGLRGFDHSILRTQSARVELPHPSQ